METLAYQTETKASKEHRCDFCGEKIPKGCTYLKSTHKLDGDVYDWKTHKYCAELATKLKMYEDAEEGVTQEMFIETISEEHYRLLTERFARNEIVQYSDILEQLRYVRWHDKLWYVIRYFAKLKKQQ